MHSLRYRRKLPEGNVGRFKRASSYWLVSWVRAEWKIPAPETWDAIRNAATTAGTLISLKN